MAGDSRNTVTQVLSFLPSKAFLCIKKATEMPGNIWLVLSNVCGVHPLAFKRRGEDGHLGLLAFVKRLFVEK